MVALAVERIEFRIPLCTARPLLEAADNAQAVGDDVRCALYLREAIRRYLVAHCEARNIKVKPKWTKPRTMLKALRKSGLDVCSWVDEVLEACNAVAHLSAPSCNMATCVDIVFSVFGTDFQREGGAV